MLCTLPQQHAPIHERHRRVSRKLTLGLLCVDDIRILIDAAMSFHGWSSLHGGELVRIPMSHVPSGGDAERLFVPLPRQQKEPAL